MDGSSFEQASALIQREWDLLTGRPLPTGRDRLRLQVLLGENGLYYRLSIEKLKGEAQTINGAAAHLIAALKRTYKWQKR